jgi:hypothetical protein
MGGLVPLALERSALYSPLALVLLGGLVSSTLLARLVTPVLYMLLPPTLEGMPVVAESAASTEVRTHDEAPPPAGSPAPTPA